MHSFGDLVGQEPRLKLPPPSARAIDRVDETMLWLRWLEPELAKLVWACAEGTLEMTSGIRQLSDYP